MLIFSFQISTLVKFLRAVSGYNTFRTTDSIQISDSLITVDEWLRERIGMSLQVTWTFAIKQRFWRNCLYHRTVIANIAEHITLFILHSSICQVRSVALSLFVTQRINRPDGKRLVSNLRRCSCRLTDVARPEHYTTKNQHGNEDNEYNVQRAVAQINEP
ncbi:hypothetical protein ALC56_08995 [Trachymyrmex septentrionalis]|uniref:Uncharacterized protein n=1 Tax=Trachymyrmex septentrionalis TaxID=34720 RepID=A0A195FAZ4_9HYME|nr:hypothetical protein ALC56_08995 [Trachymyrmex septentrionalis]